jgi:transcriptional regulator with XRE-family HTH domain
MTTLAVVPSPKRFKGPKKDALSFVRNYDGNPASAASRAFTNGIARRIATLAEMAGIEISELEQEAGLARGSIFRILSGGRQGRTSIELVARVAFALGDVDIGFLITGEFHPRNQPFVLRERQRSVSAIESRAFSSTHALRSPEQQAFEWLQPQARALPTKKRRKPVPRKKKPQR